MKRFLFTLSCFCMATTVAQADIWEGEYQLSSGLTVKRSKDGISVHNPNSDGGTFHSPTCVAIDEGVMLGSVPLHRVNLHTGQTEVAFVQEASKLGSVIQKVNVAQWDRTYKLENGLEVTRTAKGVTILNPKANGGFYFSPLRVSVDEGNMLGDVRLHQVHLTVDQNSREFFNEVTKLGNILPDNTWQKEYNLENGLKVVRTPNGIAVDHPNGQRLISGTAVSVDEGVNFGNTRMPQLHLDIGQGEASFAQEVSKLGSIVAEDLSKMTKKQRKNYNKKLRKKRKYSSRHKYSSKRKGRGTRVRKARGHRRARR